MRNFKTADLFTMSRILKKMDIKKDVVALAKDISGLSAEGKKQEEEKLKVNLTMLLVENLGNAEQECYKFLADLSGKKPVDIENQSIRETTDMIKEILSQDGFESFLSTAAKSTMK